MQCKNVELKNKAMSLTFREKNALAKELANDSFIDKDKDILRKHLPQEKLLSRSPSSRPDLSFDILFVLLDYETPESIRANRDSFTEVKEVKTVIDDNPTRKTSQSKGALKKKLPKKRSIQRLDGPTLRAKT